MVPPDMCCAGCAHDRVSLAVNDARPYSPLDCSEAGAEGLLPPLPPKPKKEGSAERVFSVPGELVVGEDVAVKGREEEEGELPRPGLSSGAPTSWRAACRGLLRGGTGG